MIIKREGHHDLGLIIQGGLDFLRCTNIFSLLRVLEVNVLHWEDGLTWFLPLLIQELQKARQSPPKHFFFCFLFILRDEFDGCLNGLVEIIVGQVESVIFEGLDLEDLQSASLVPKEGVNHFIFGDPEHLRYLSQGFNSLLQCDSLWDELLPSLVREAKFKFTDHVGFVLFAYH